MAPRANIITTRPKTGYLVPEGARVLDLGCRAGRLLAELRPSAGVGVDLSPCMIDIARRSHPGLNFLCGDFEDPQLLDRTTGPFGFIVLSDASGFVDYCQAILRRLHRLCHPSTPLVLAYFNQLWRPFLRLGEAIGHKMRERPRAGCRSRISASCWSSLISTSSAPSAGS